MGRSHSMEGTQARRQRPVGSPRRSDAGRPIGPLLPFERRPIKTTAANGGRLTVLQWPCGSPICRCESGICAVAARGTDPGFALTTEGCRFCAQHKPPPSHKTPPVTAVCVPATKPPTPQPTLHPGKRQPKTTVFVARPSGPHFKFLKPNTTKRETNNQPILYKTTAKHTKIAPERQQAQKKPRNTAHLPYTLSVWKNPLWGSTKKTRMPSTMHDVTTTWVPPQSNSASNWRPPSRGEAPKNWYLRGGLR